MPPSPPIGVFVKHSKHSHQQVCCAVCCACWHTLWCRSRCCCPRLRIIIAVPCDATYIWHPRQTFAAARTVTQVKALLHDVEDVDAIIEAVPYLMNPKELQQSLANLARWFPNQDPCKHRQPVACKASTHVRTCIGSWLQSVGQLGCSMLPADCDRAAAAYTVLLLHALACLACIALAHYHL
jgi:hypothetical protein